MCQHVPTVGCYDNENPKIGAFGSPVFPSWVDRLGDLHLRSTPCGVLDTFVEAPWLGLDNLIESCAGD